MQYERHALGRGQRIQHDQHGRADRIGQQHFVFRTGTGIGGGQRRVRHQVHRFLAAHLARTQQIQRQPGHHRRQPTGEIADLGRVGTIQAQPRLLHHVLGFGVRTQHAERHCLEPGAVGLELFGQSMQICHGERSWGKPD